MKENIEITLNIIVYSVLTFLLTLSFGLIGFILGAIMSYSAYNYLKKRKINA